MAVKLTYFPLFAKGPSCALALAHSGMEWEGAFPDDWKSLKPTTPWGHLPLLEIPGVGSVGHEAAILNWIGRQSPEMDGESDAEFVISQQLIGQSEDVYQKLGQVQPTIMQAEKVPPEDLEKFWSDANSGVHNRHQGINVHLTLLEAFYRSCPPGAASPEAGTFTASGTSCGECKLFTTLHILKMIKDDVLDSYPGLTCFYQRFGDLEKTQEILTTGGNFPSAFKQYFIAP